MIPVTQELADQTQEILEQAAKFLAEEAMAIELSQIHLMDDDESPVSRAA